MAAVSEGALARAEQHVREWERRIADQAGLVGELDTGGHRARAEARARLTIFQAVLDLAREDLCSNVREVGGPSVLEIRALPDDVVPAGWRVEHADADGKGACAVTIFAGFDAELRAREYAEWLRSRGPAKAGNVT